MELNKPLELADLDPPFDRIDDPGWDSAFSNLLDAYGVRKVNPVSEPELVARENELGYELESSHRLFLLTFGPIDFKSNRVLPLSEIGPLTDVWFADKLSRSARKRLPTLIGVMDYLGTGDVIAWDRQAHDYPLVGHDPPGVHPWLATFDDAIREQCVLLASGYYGWPDAVVEELVDRKRLELFPGRRRRGRE